MFENLIRLIKESKRILKYYETKITNVFLVIYVCI